MRILLSDGAGLTARQCATVLSLAGHRVEALSPDPLCLCRFTRRVRKVHGVPGIGTDPLGWLDAALGVAARRRVDVLLPVQEQVAVMSLARERIAKARVLTAVPDFAALAQVQDKVSAFGTLARLGLPQPPGAVVTSAAGSWQRRSHRFTPKRRSAPPPRASGMFPPPLSCASWPHPGTGTRRAC